MLSAEKALISTDALRTTTGAFDVAIGGPVRSVANTGTNGLIAVAGSTTVTLSGEAFSKSDIGRVFKDTAGVPNGATIVSVSPNGRNATISEPAIGGGTNVAAVSNLNITAGNRTIPGTFTGADVGAVVGANNVGIPAGTVIESLDGSSAVLSAAPGTTNSTTGSITLTRRSAVVLFPAAPVLEGAYNLTIVSDGTVGAESRDSHYQQTAVTSGSTFTVGSF